MYLLHLCPFIVCLCLMHISDFSDFMLLTLVYRALTVFVGRAKTVASKIYRVFLWALGLLNKMPQNVEIRYDGACDKCEWPCHVESKMYQLHTAHE